METATDRLANPKDARVEVIERQSSFRVKVRYIESGTVSVIHPTHLVEFAVDDTAQLEAKALAAAKKLGPAPMVAVPGTVDPLYGNEANAHTRYNREDGTTDLFVRFMNGKVRHVGNYDSRGEARKAYAGGTYGF